MNKYHLQVGTRFKGDGLVNGDRDWQPGVVNICISGEQPKDHLGLSFYNYGAMVYFGHSSNQLEFHGMHQGGYVACCTMVATNQYNEFQVRGPRDENSITFTYRMDEMPCIGTEFAKTPLRIDPKGELHLKGAALVIESPIRIPWATIKAASKDLPAHISLKMDGQEIRIPLL